MTRHLLFVALVCSLATPAAFAQSPGLPAQPVPIVPSPAAQPPAFAPAPVAPQPQPGTLPPIGLPRTDPVPAPGPVAIVPAPGPVAIVPATPIFLQDPVRPVAVPVRPACGQEGFYGMFEISLLFPELHGWLNGPVTVANTPQTVQLSSASLDSTGSPQLEIGYRLGDNWGAVAVKYRSIVSHGSDTVANFDILGDGFLTTRLNVNVLDIDYVSPCYDFDPLWGFAWRAGVRGAAVYFDDQAQGSFLQLHTSSNFIGAGPHAQLELARAFPAVPGLAVITRLDGAVLLGNISQSFEETVTFPHQQFGGASRFDHTQTVPVFTFDLGLTYTPCLVNWARFGFGYQFEYWWDVGTSGNSHGDLGANSLYFRGEFNF